METRQMQALIHKIKEKRELSGVADSVVERELKSFLKKHNISLEDLKKSDIKMIIKSIRADLRTLTGQYQKRTRARKRTPGSDSQTLLTTHASTAERLTFYPHLRKIIGDLNPNSILDLGCGLNPLALANSSITYYACDINEQDIIAVKNYFKEKNIKGEAFICDVRSLPDALPQADLCLIFKVLDLIEKKTHTRTEEILNNVNAKKFLISFPTKKLSGKRMNVPRRGWIEHMFVRLGFTFKTFSSDNEFFYLATRATK